jgi:hypothetical protein
MTDIDVQALQVPDDQVLDPVDDGLTDEDIDALITLQQEGDADEFAHAEPTEQVEGTEGDDSIDATDATAFLATPSALISVPKPSGTVAQMAARAVSWFVSKAGTKESPRYSNHIFIWLDVKPDWNGEPYCAAGVTDAWARQGVDLRRVISNPYYCPNLEAMAKSYGAWQPNNGKYSPRPGDISLMGRSGYASHTGLAAPTSGSYSGYRQIEANTSAGNSGSQTNGDGIYIRFRDSGFIRGWINMAALIPALRKAGLVGKPSTSKPKPTPSKPAISFATTMKFVTGSKRGLKNGNVAIMQRALNAQSSIRPCPLDSKWSGAMQAPYARYQRACGYQGADADGIPGYSTWARLMSWAGYTPTK